MPPRRRQNRCSDHMDIAPVAAFGARLIRLDAVGSTNAEALERARAGEPGPLWIAARRQTAGRGRRGRGWVSEPGNLYASLLLTDPAPAPRAAELSLVAALAVHDAVAEIASGLGPRLKLKWPNDVVCRRARRARPRQAARTRDRGPHRNARRSRAADGAPRRRPGRAHHGG